MSSKRIGIGIIVPLIVVMVFVFGLFLYAPPTDQIETIYEHMAMNTSGDGPAIGMAWVDPLTDVIFHNIGEEMEVTFFILAPEVRAVDFDSIRYITGDGVEVIGTEFLDTSFDGWSSCHYTVKMVCTTTENTYISIRTADTFGLDSSRLFYIIAIG